MNEMHLWCGPEVTLNLLLDLNRIIANEWFWTQNVSKTKRGKRKIGLSSTGLRRVEGMHGGVWQPSSLSNTREITYDIFWPVWKLMLNRLVFIIRVVLFLHTFVERFCFCPPLPVPVFFYPLLLDWRNFGPSLKGSSYM